MWIGRRGPPTQPLISDPSACHSFFPFAMIFLVLFLNVFIKLSWCSGKHLGLPCREAQVQIPAGLTWIVGGFCCFFFKIAWFSMIFISFSSPWTKTVILLLHSVKVLEPYRIQSAPDQGYVKLKMDLVGGGLSPNWANNFWTRLIKYDHSAWLPYWLQQKL